MYCTVFGSCMGIYMTTCTCTCSFACVNCNIIVLLTVVHVQGANQNAASASVISPAGQQRLANGSEVLSPTSTLHTHGGGSPEMREITV